MKSDPRPFDYLKRHVPTNLALGAAFLAAAMPLVGAMFIWVPHGYVAGRSSPLHWLIMLPLGVWAWGVTSFEPWAIRLLTPVLIAAPLVSVALATASHPNQDDAITLWSLTAASLVMSVLGGVALHRSPLWPLRRRQGR